ncbi:MAG: hypothetical protein SGI88_05560, partial [Candidatus Hydrogenedentes bacterium]|nr:hypothetical protein [Candidatus Hydrogenedentota bacterium]
MKQKYVAPLAVVFLILLGLVVFKQMNKPVIEITQQVKLTALAPEGLAKTDIAKIELYSGDNAEEKLTLARNDADASVWWITSHFNAPANAEKVEKFLDTALALEGEPRDKNAGEVALESYNLTDDTAFHVKGFKKGEATAAFDVLVGKAPAMDQVFM